MVIIVHLLNSNTQIGAKFEFCNLKIPEKEVFPNLSMFLYFFSGFSPGWRIAIFLSKSGAKTD